MFDSIINRGEYLSNHYLDALIQGDLTSLRRRWDDAETRDEPTARTRLRALSRPFFAAKAKAIEGDPARHSDEVRVLHDLVLDALGFPADRRPLTLVRADQDVTVMAATTCDTHTGLLLVALDLGFATDVDAALEPDGAGRLLDPDGLRDSGIRIRDGAKAASALFGADDPPRYVLLLAGTILILADRGPWGEGRFLAVDLDLALSRNDTKAKGELETIAALFSADAIVPEEGQSVADQLVSASRKHAVGVSKDLREGIRRSVELLADEVIEQRRAANLGVYNVPGLAGDLTVQSLRFLYRLLFVLYAEARPELGILPLDHPEYAQGYGLDRLRDLVLVDLTEDRARNGKHLHESLSLLFRLINDGYHHAVAQQALALDAEPASEDVGLRFEPLHSALFAPDATPLLDGVTLRNRCLQAVLRLLMLSKEKSGQDRGFVSYANLGINQLGAVYEGLMAYTGFFATEDLYEVARPGHAEHGTWVVPVADADQYPGEVFVRRPNAETGQPELVRHPKGSFVFRLSGRDRQRTASYYTPEVLTACVVRHALAELLDQDGETTPAGRILDLKICEPALGSGAFLNEAINQLAHEYLRRRQAELDMILDPDRYQVELQKVKAHIALHQCYGVDLNGTAVELAEVSLWLNAMHPGLQAPWFGLHLRRGNSLLGGRRATYRRAQLDKGVWLKAVPEDRPLSGDTIGDDEIHHFLLPAAGWGSVADNKYARELRPDAVKALKEWRKTITEPPSKNDADRLVGLARRVEILWARALERLRLAERELRRPIDLWEAPEPIRGKAGSRALIEEALRDPNSSLGRIRLVMDAWCALWFWPVDGPTDPPSVALWLDALECLLGVHEKEPAPGQLAFFDDLDDLLKRDRDLTFEAGMRPTAEVVEAHSCLADLQRIAAREGFFHWELEFAPVFAAGGFELQVGNPPWVRPTWEDNTILAEADPWFGVTERWSEAEFAQRRATALHSMTAAMAYIRELSSYEGLNRMLSAVTLRPLLSGIQTNLYMVFADTVWRNTSASGIASLLHPESHFVDPKAKALRRAAYARLRRHWQFANGLFLFEDVHDTTFFGVHVYGEARNVSFLQVSAVLHPEVVDGSLQHDGVGELPGIQYPWGGWDLRPHRARVLNVDNGVLRAFAELFDEPGTQPEESRLLRPVTTHDLAALGVLANYSSRLGGLDYKWTSGFHEKGAKEAGIIRWETKIPSSWKEGILQGPHFTVANPFAKQPNENCRHNQDYSPWDLETLPDHAVPRTNYQRSVPRDAYEEAIPHWDGNLSTESWRIIVRAMTQPGLERSFHAALIPPGPMHVHSALAIGLPVRELVAACGLWCSIVVDYLMKVSGIAFISDQLLRHLPIHNGGVFTEPILLRVLRLNCLTAAYGTLWEDLFSPVWKNDTWTESDSERSPISNIGRSWTFATPLRSDYDRRLALVELDALTALVVGLTVEQINAMYRTQFPVLRKYEYVMWFDSNGRKVPPDVVKAWQAGSTDLGRYALPFSQPDREKEMTRAFEEFRRRHGGGQA
jgi:hypothetical protein